MGQEVWRSNKPRGLAASGDKLGAVVGGVLGGVYSGGAGTATGAISGAQMGSQIGGMAGNLLGQNSAPSENVDNPLARRISASPKTFHAETEDPRVALEEANIALAQQPPEVRQQYEPAIKAALLKSRRETV